MLNCAVKDWIRLPPGGNRMTAAIPHLFGDTSPVDAYPPEFWEQTEGLFELISDFHDDLVEAVVVGLKDLIERRDDEALDQCVDEFLCDQKSRYHTAMAGL